MRWSASPKTIRPRRSARCVMSWTAAHRSVSVNAYRIPDSVDDAQGALIEPLSCAVHGLRRIGPVIGEDILLTGAGTMGLLLQLLTRAGARSVSVVDRKAVRLQAAEALGAASVAEDVAALDRGSFGVAVDATGVPAAIEAGFGALGRGARLLIFGVADRRVGTAP
jgi:threonine dehydrogenase-like Zn-dependent dehydrogenase